MVIAFSGWNDAGEAASNAASHLLGCWTDPEFDVGPQLIAEVAGKRTAELSDTSVVEVLHRDDLVLLRS